MDQLRKKSVQEFHHALTDAEAAILKDGGISSPLHDIKKTGATVKLKSGPVQNTYIAVIRGSPCQIEKALEIINRKTGAEGTIAQQAERFWLRWVEDAFPDLQSRAYFLPPVFMHRVPVTMEMFAGHVVRVLTAPLGQAGQAQPPPSAGKRQVHDSDVRDDAAMQRVVAWLGEMSECHREVLVGLSRLAFQDYLGEKCYRLASGQLPTCSSPGFKWRRGDFDVLLIHRHYGLVVCEVKAVGHSSRELALSQEQAHHKIRDKLTKACEQLRKATAVLAHLVSDVTSDLRISVAMAFPYLSACQIKKVIADDYTLAQNLSDCLGTSTDPTDISSACLCSEELPPPNTSRDASDDALTKLLGWWKRRVARTGPDPNMTSDVYRRLLARFCGPATTVSVPCTSPPRTCIKTLGPAVSLVGARFAEISLFPEQVHLLRNAPPRVFLAGPPGTGKTVVLLLRATAWLLHGKDVLVLTSWSYSRAANVMLHHQLLQTLATQQQSAATPGRLHWAEFEFVGGKDVARAVQDVTRMARMSSEGSLCLVADEAGPDGHPWGGHFKVFCEKLLARHPGLNLWAANCLHGVVPAGWVVEHMTRPLRCPPAVVREVEQAEQMTTTPQRPPLVQAYSGRRVPDPTDGPPVRRVCHGGPLHAGDDPRECVQCGQEVAGFLRQLRVGNTENTAGARQGLAYRDVLVLCNLGGLTQRSGMFQGLTGAGIPVRLMTTNEDTDDAVTARSNVVWMTSGHRVRGLERKVVVCVEDSTRLHEIYHRLLYMSRCTSQLVLVIKSQTTT